MTQTAGRAHPTLVFGRGETLFWFVSVEDVAALVVRCVTQESLRGRALEISGPEPATTSELARQLMARMAWVGRPRHVPRPVLHVMANTVGLVGPGVRRQARGALMMNTLHRGEAIPAGVPGFARAPESEVVARLPVPVAS